MREHIDSCHKQFESHATYAEHINSHVNNVANVTIDSDGITLQKKKYGKERNIQKDNDIYFKENEPNKSIIVS